MSIDKSLRRKDTLARARSVLTRGERILVLQKEEKWQEGRSPFGLPKVRVLKIAKKPKKAAKEEPKEGEEAAAAAEAAAAPAAAPTDKKAAAEKKAPADKKAATEKKK
jgi:small basic protein (TIGR04137 family)